MPDLGLRIRFVCEYYKMTEKSSIKPILEIFNYSFHSIHQQNVYITLSHHMFSSVYVTDDKENIVAEDPSAP